MVGIAVQLRPMSPKEAIREAAKVMAGPAKLAARLGVSKSTVSQWLTDDARLSRPVPPKHCPIIERLTEGRVRCEQLHPEIDWAYLRATDCPVHGGHKGPA